MRELREVSLEEKGVVNFETARVDGKSNEFVLWEVYADTAAWDAHAGSEHFKRLVIDGLRSLARQRIAETLFPL